MKSSKGKKSLNPNPSQDIDIAPLEKKLSNTSLDEMFDMIARDDELLDMIVRDVLEEQLRVQKQSQFDESISETDHDTVSLTKNHEVYNYPPIKSTRTIKTIK